MIIITILQLSLFSQNVYACDFAGSVDNYLSIFDMDGKEVDKKKLDLFSVGGDCSILNMLFPSTQNKLYIEDKANILSLVDLSKNNGKWSVQDEYNFDYENTFVLHYSNLLGVYDYQIVITDFDPFQLNLLNYSAIPIVLYNLKNSSKNSMHIDLLKSLDSYENFTINISHNQDNIKFSFASNWILISSIIHKNFENSPSTDETLWLYRHNLATGENSSVFKSVETDFHIDFYSKIGITNNGSFGYIIEDYPWKTIYIADFEANTLKKVNLNERLKPGMIKGNYIYGISIIESDNGSKYYFKRFNINNNEIETISQITGIYPDNVIVLDNYLIAPHTAASSSNFFNTNNTILYPMILIILCTAIILRYKRRVDKINRSSF